MKLQHVVAGGILKIDGKVLILRRLMTDTSSQGYWEYPKGRVEWGEAPEAALRREFLEETNLRIEPLVVAGTQSHTYSRDGNEIHMVTVDYLVKLAESESPDNIKLTEHDAHRWVSVRDLADVEPMHDSVKQNLLSALK